MTRALVLMIAILALTHDAAASPIALPSAFVDVDGYIAWVVPGDYVLLDASRSYSPASENSPPFPIVFYEWDLNNDGIFEGNPSDQFVIHTLAGAVPSDLLTSSPFVYWRNANWAYGLNAGIALRVSDELGQKSLVSYATIHVVDSYPFAQAGPHSPQVTVPENAAGVELIAGSVVLAGYIFRAPYLRRRRQG